MSQLTPRMLEVGRLVAAGQTDKQIATKLAISVQRVAQLVDAIGERLKLDPQLDIRIQIAKHFTARAA